MSAERVEQAKRNAVMARRRLDSTLGALQLRLKPGNLAGEAWDGVKDKSADLADGALTAVRKRPAVVSAAVGALALFLARDPIRRAVTRLVASEEEEADDLVTARIETVDPKFEDPKFNVSAPIAEAPVTEGVQ